MDDMFVAIFCVSGFSLSLVAIHAVLCALGRVFPRLGAMMGE